MNKKIKVLIVDDSAMIRSMLREILANDEQIEVVGLAIDPLDAREKIKQLNPDVITLDVEMPKMDGISFLEKIMTLRPTPTIMVSTLTGRGTDIAIAALEIGAVDCIGKPTDNNQVELETFAKELRQKVHTAATAKLIKVKANIESFDDKKQYKLKASAPKLIAIGASTGGVEAIAAVITKLPKETPPVIITQHMPAAFTANFAKRLGGNCAVEVVESANGMILNSGRAIIARGDLHLEIKLLKGFYSCVLSDAGHVSGHKPSVDVMFESVAKCAGSDALGILLTGMGKDGAAGLLKMRTAGAHTIAQSEDSCVVYGMPKRAVEIGAAVEIVDLGNIEAVIKKRCFQ